MRKLTLLRGGHGFKFLFCHKLPVRLWSSHLASLGLNAPSLPASPAPRARPVRKQRCSGAGDRGQKGNRSLLHLLPVGYRVFSISNRTGVLPRAYSVTASPRCEYTLTTLSSSLCGTSSHTCSAPRLGKAAATSARSFLLRGVIITIINHNNNNNHPVCYYLHSPTSGDSPSTPYGDV